MSMALNRVNHFGTNIELSFTILKGFNGNIHYATITYFILLKVQYTSGFFHWKYYAICPIKLYFINLNVWYVKVSRNEKFSRKISFANFSIASFTFKMAV